MAKTKFNPLWLEKKEYKPWLDKCDKSIYDAYCKFFQKSFSLSKMAEHAIISHKASLKHKATVDTVNQRISIKNFFSNATSTAQQEEKPAENVDNAVLNLTEKVTDKAELTQNNNKTGSQLTMSFYTSKNETTKAEIIWCFNSVYNHLSQSAAGKSVDVMKLMFTDSEIAAAMKLSRTKIGYTIAYDLGPYFQSQLLDEIRDSHHFCVSFDESLNTISQKEQQDIWVRFWSKVSHRPETRYIGSAFLGHTKASDLINGYKCQLKSIDSVSYTHLDVYKRQSIYSVLYIIFLNCYFMGII